MFAAIERFIEALIAPYVRQFDRLPPAALRYMTAVPF